MSKFSTQQFFSEMKLAADRQKFGEAAIKILNALTTGFFGWQYLGGLTIQLLAPLPLSPTATDFLSRIFGALASIVVLDAGYLYWQHVRLNSCKTTEQIKAAHRAEFWAFWLSCVFSAVTLLTVILGDGMPPSMALWVFRVSAVLFSGMFVLHLITVKSYTSNAPEFEIQLVETEMSANQTTEQLQLSREVQREGLLMAKQLFADNREAHVKQYAGKFLGQIETNVKRGLNDGAVLPAHVDTAPAETDAADNQLPLPIIVQPIPQTPRPDFLAVNGTNGHK